MRIALVSTCAVATPPKGYGGTELVVAELSRGLTALGHDVTVFATGDSSPGGTLRYRFESPVWPPDDLAEIRHAAFALREIAERGDFDVVHLNHAAAIPFHFVARVPCVVTIHHHRVPRLEEHYRACDGVAFVAISRRQAELSPGLAFAQVIHHGLDPRAYPYGEGRGGFAAFLGRFAAEKGTHVALDACAAAGLPLRLGGSLHQVDDAQTYFASEIQPRLGARSGAEWLGELSPGPKVELLREARALLFPIDWEEPFGLVMIEAMLVGTPVIAFPRGSVPEVVEEGVTGFIVRSAGEMAARLADLDRFDRRRCRARACERWSTARMSSAYAALFADLAARHRARERGGGLTGTTVVAEL